MDKLEQAIISLIETQVKLAERQVDADKRWFEIRHELDQVIKILNEHTVLLQRMPQAVRESVGFKAG
jgi:hypothetical protein